MHEATALEPKVRAWPAWWMTIKVSLAEYAAYKANLFLLVIGPAIVFWFVKYNIWSSIFHHTQLPTIQGYDLKQMLAYQTWVLLVGLIGQGHNSMALAEDIRMGRISSYLIYPFSFWKFHTAHFLAFLGVQSFVSLLCLVTALSAGAVSLPDWPSLIVGIVLTFAVSFLWFLIQFIIGLIAFWLEETWILRVMFTMIAQFCSGASIPLDVYPQWLQHALAWSPFLC